MKSRPNPRTIKAIKLYEDSIEKTQREMNRVITEMNQALRQLSRDTYEDLVRGQAIHEQSNLAVSALNSDEGVLRFRVSGTKHYLLTRMGTVLYGTVLSTTLTGPA